MLVIAQRDIGEGAFRLGRVSALIVVSQISIEAKINAIIANSRTRCVIVIKWKITNSSESAVVDSTDLTHIASTSSIDIVLIFEDE